MDGRPDPAAGAPAADAPASDDWSEPAIYSGGRPLPMRTFTESDPISAVLFPVWELEQRLGDDEPGTLGSGSRGAAGTATRTRSEPQWSAPTYNGRRRRRPKAEPAAAAPPVAAPVTGTEPAPGAAVDAATADPSAIEVAPGPVAKSAEESDRAVLSSSRSMAVASVVSRLTGFLRSILLLAALGSTTAVSIAYNSGNTFPNMVYELLLGGVLSSVFIPLLVHAQELDSDDGVGYAQRLMSIATAVLGGLTILAVLAAPWIAGVFARPESRELTTVFATLLLPEIFFYGVGAMLMAVLNIRRVYTPGAWAPVLNNVIMIATLGVFWLLPGPKTFNDPSSITTTQILVLGIGTTLGIAAQALVLVPYLRRSGFRWQWRFRARPHEVGRMKDVGVLAGWVLVYVVASQIGVSVIQKVGNSNGGLTVFTNVDLLFQVPYGIVVVSLLTAIMPRMSRNAVREDHEAVKQDLRLGASLSAVGMVPITAGLIVLGVPLCVVLFAHGQTTIDGAHLLGSALAWSAFGLLPFSIVMLQLRVFYAMRDGKTAAIINVFMVATKIALVLITNAVYQAAPHVDVNKNPSVRAVEWLNIATSVSYVVGAIVGHIVLTRRLGRLGFSAVASTTMRMAVASVVGGLAAWAVMIEAHDRFGTGHGGELVAVLGGSVVGLVVLALVATQLRIPEIDALRSRFGRRRAS